MKEETRQALMKLLLSEYRPEIDCTLREVLTKIKHCCTNDHSNIDVLIYFDLKKNAPETLETLVNHVNDKEAFQKDLLDVQGELPGPMTGYGVGGGRHSVIRKNALYWLLKRYTFATMERFWGQLTPVMKQHVYEGEESTVTFLFRLCEKCSEFMNEEYRRRRYSSGKALIYGAVVGAVAVGALAAGIAVKLELVEFRRDAVDDTAVIIRPVVFGGLLSAVVAGLSSAALLKMYYYTQERFQRPNGRSDVDPTASTQRLLINILTVLKLKDGNPEPEIAKTLLTKVLKECCG